MSRLLIPGIIDSTSAAAEPSFVAVGNFSKYDPATTNAVAILSSSGTADETFLGSLRGVNSVYDAVEQSDGKIILVGNFTTWGNNTGTGTVTVGRIIRLNTNGTIDSGFNSGTGANGTIEKILLQSDGKIIIGGGFNAYNGAGANRILRLNSDGTRDTSFTIGAGFSSGTVNDMKLQSDGKIVIVGTFTSYAGSTVNRIVRLNTNGTRDTTFVTGTGFSGTAHALAIRGDGKIIVSVSPGTVTYNGVVTNGLCRINSDGTRDTTLNGVSNSGTTTTNTILCLPDDKMILGGSFNSYNGATAYNAVKLNSDGSRDTAVEYIFTGGNVEHIQLINDKLIVVGAFLTYDNINSANYIIRLNLDGTVDTSFDIGLGFQGTKLFVVIPLANGNILVGGNIQFYKGTVTPRIANVLMDETINTLFDPGVGASSQIFSIDKSSNRLAIGGSFATFNNEGYSNFIKLKFNGDTDQLFSYPSFNNQVTSVKFQSDGKVLVGGSFSAVGGETHNHIVRLNADGTIDASFLSGTGFDDGMSSINDIYVLQNGNILVRGNFTSYDGNTLPWSGFVVLDQFGIIENSFTYPNIFNGATVSAVYITTNGDAQSIYLAGEFNIDPVGTISLIKLATNGTLENDFPMFVSTNGTITNLGVLSNGNVVLLGNFTSVSSSSSNSVASGIALVEPNGGLAMENSNSGTGFAGGFPLDIKIDQNDNMLISGSFTSYNGTTASRIIKLANGLNILNTFGNGFDGNVNKLTIL